MDPKATWLKFLAECDENDVLEAYHTIAELDAWFKKGGFRINDEPGWPTAAAVNTLFHALTWSCKCQNLID